MLSRTIQLNNIEHWYIIPIQTINTLCNWNLHCHYNGMCSTVWRLQPLKVIFYSIHKILLKNISFFNIVNNNVNYTLLKIYFLRLSRESYRSTSNWNHKGIKWLAFPSVKYINVHSFVRPATLQSSSYPSDHGERSFKPNIFRKNSNSNRCRDIMVGSQKSDHSINE